MAVLSKKLISENNITNRDALSFRAIQNSPYQDWTDFTVGEGKLVATTINASRAYYTSDGITFNYSTTPNLGGGLGIAYGNGKFVIVGPGGACYSSDAINWSTSPIPTGNPENPNWHAVAYGGGVFVAVSINGYASYSADCINWSPIIELPLKESSFYYKITYGDNKFVAISIDGVFSYSIDGQSWNLTSQNYPDNSSSYESIAFGLGKFISINAAAQDNIGLKSDDGINWVIFSFNVALGQRPKVFFVNNFFITISEDEQTYISYDAITWTKINVLTSETSGSLNYSHAVYFNDKIIILIINSSYHAISTQFQAGAYFNSFKGGSLGSYETMAFYQDNNFIIYSNYLNGTTVSKSTDGITWQQVGTTLLSASSAALGPDGDHYVIARNSNNNIYLNRGNVSGNFGSYTAIKQLSSLLYAEVIYAQGYIVLAIDNTINTSNDQGVTWNSITLPTAAKAERLFYNTFEGSSAFYVRLDSGGFYSTDLVNWTPTIRIKSIGGNYATTANDELYIGSLGSWTFVNSNVSWVAYGNGMYLRYGSTTSYSYGGGRWFYLFTPRSNAELNNVNSIIFGANRFNYFNKLGSLGAIPFY